MLSRTIIDFTVTNKDGQVLIDTKKERMTRQQDFYELINDCGGDPTAVKILESFKNALAHDEKLLEYLYEIRDTLSIYFGNEGTAKQELNLSSTKWSKFGTLANNWSIKEIRHHLETAPNSREISKKDRNFAFSFGLTMIESFLNYLKQHGYR